MTNWLSFQNRNYKIQRRIKHSQPVPIQTIIVLVLLLFPFVASCSTTNIKTRDGFTTEALYRDCQIAINDTNTFSSSLCRGFIEGVTAGIDAGAMEVLKVINDGKEQVAINNLLQKQAKFCYPNHTAPPAELVAKKLTAWIAQNNIAEGSLMSRPAISGLLYVFSQIFPCNKFDQ